MQEPTTEAPSVADRLFLILEHCGAANRPLSLAELVERTGLPKTTLHRMCWKLVHLGGLECSGDGFRIGTRLFALGSMHPEVRRLRAVSMPYLHALTARSGQMANLAVRSGDKALLVEEVYGNQQRAARMIGAELPLHATAVGKALISGCDGDEIATLEREVGFAPFTRHTIVRRSVLIDHLAGVRERRCAFSSEEWRIGAAGAAAPIVVDGQVRAAIALVGPPNDTAMRSFAQALRVAAGHVEAALARHERPPVAA